MLTVLLYTSVFFGVFFLFVMIWGLVAIARSEEPPEHTRRQICHRL
jgi:hypothetical protein